MDSKDNNDLEYYDTECRAEDFKEVDKGIFYRLVDHKIFAAGVTPAGKIGIYEISGDYSEP